MGYFSERHYSHTIQIRCNAGREQWDEIKRWCHTTLGPYIIEESYLWHCFYLRFQSDRDLTLFRLKYGDLETFTLPRYTCLFGPKKGPD